MLDFKDRHLFTQSTWSLHVLPQFDDVTDFTTFSLTNILFANIFFPHLLFLLQTSDFLSQCVSLLED